MPVLIVWVLLGCSGEGVRVHMMQSVNISTLMMEKTNTNKVESNRSSTMTFQEVIHRARTSGVFTTVANVPGFCRDMMEGMELRGITLSKMWPIESGTLSYMHVRDVSLGEDTMLYTNSDHLVIDIKNIAVIVDARFQITTWGDLDHKGSVTCEVSGGGFSAYVPLNCNGEQECDGSCSFDDSLNMIVQDINASNKGSLLGHQVSIPKGFYESVMKAAVGSAVSRIGVTQAAMAAIEQGLCTKVLKR